MSYLEKEFPWGSGKQQAELAKLRFVQKGGRLNRPKFLEAATNYYLVS